MGFIKKKNSEAGSNRVWVSSKKNPKSNRQSNNIELKRKRAKVGNRF